MQIFHSNDFILSGEGVNIICATPDVNVHAHEFYELVYVDSGCARHNVAGSVYDIGAGDLFLVDIGVEHSYSERSPDFSVINCLFMPAFLSNVVNNDSAFSELAETVFFKSFAHPDKPFFIRAGVVPGARSIIAQMLDEHKSKNNGYLQVIQALLKVLLIYALRAYSDDDGLRRHSKLADEIGVGAACRQLGLSTKTVYNWRRAERLARGELQGVQPGETPEQALKRMTREMRELQEANYILKKALGFMAGR